MSVIKHTDPVPDPRAVNQDKKNMLFSVRDSSVVCLSLNSYYCVFMMTISKCSDLTVMIG